MFGLLVTEGGQVWQIIQEVASELTPLVVGNHTNVNEGSLLQEVYSELPR